MKKSLFVLLAILAVLSFPAFAQGGGEAASPKIGFMGPMSGDYANYGVLSNNSAMLAVEQFNAKGGFGENFLSYSSLKIPKDESRRVFPP